MVPPMTKARGKLKSNFLFVIDRFSAVGATKLKTLNDDSIIINNLFNAARTLHSLFALSEIGGFYCVCMCASMFARVSINKFGY